MNPAGWSARGTPLEVWGGIECTANRVGDRIGSQLRRNGHRDRIEADLDAFAGLGLSALRYPVLWEEVEPDRGERDFALADRALHHLRTTGMSPIVGLLHHGSGPLHASLGGHDFGPRFAEYAGAVAARYPWVRDYTPINEPLTTARFSGLYGFWYPHARDDGTFVRLLLNQVRATVLAMRAIRAVNPGARLVQTEDLGRAGGTEPLAGQIAFENERRWLTFDLLCGRVDTRHPLFDYLTRSARVSPDELAWFAVNPCPPDVVGINHYPRSNRWLDHRLELFDAAHHGGNDHIRYADTACSDTAHASAASLASLIDEAWQRYGVTIALSEVHVHGDTDEQVAWWQHAVASAETARGGGTDVCAVTTWSLLGSFDWNTLCTSSADTDDVNYEPGAFQVAHGRRELTPLAQSVRETVLRVSAPSATDGDSPTGAPMSSIPPSEPHPLALKG